MRVAFFQRVFAHYQWGLVQELAEHSQHEYVFFGDTRDPGQTGIAPIPSDRRSLVDYRVVRTWQPSIYLAVQPAAVWMGLIGHYDAFILEGSFLHPTAWAAMFAAKARGKRVLLYTHGWRRRDANAVVGAARLAFYRQADGLLLYGARAKAIGLSLGIPSERMYVVFNSLDHRKMVTLRDAISDDQCLALKERLFGDRNVPVVAYVGRIVAAKRVDLLIDACAEAMRKGCNLGLLIVGDGPQMEPLKSKASQLGVPAHFTGPLYDEDELSLLISASNVSVVPGPIGLSAIHAMTYGTPVITDDAWDSQGPEVEAVIAGQTGAFFRSGDSGSLAETLMSFLADPDSRVQYAPHCMAMVDRFYNPGYMRMVFDRAVSGRPAKNAPGVGKNMT